MNPSLRTRVLALASASLALVALAPGVQAQSGPPIRVGSTLALTGPLSATAQVHKLVGEIYVEQLNKRGGLLGRPVEWIVKDDQSKPDLARTLYEQLITADKVEAIIELGQEDLRAVAAGRDQRRLEGRAPVLLAMGQEDAALDRQALLDPGHKFRTVGVA